MLTRRVLQVAAEAMGSSGLVAKLLVAYNPKGLEYLLAVGDGSRFATLASCPALLGNQAAGSGAG